MKVMVVTNIFIKRIGFTLIRVHRQQTLNADQSTAEVLLQQLKWPIETLFVGMKIKDYNSSDASKRREHLDKWHTFTQITSTVRTTQGWKAGKTTLKNAEYNAGAALTFSNGGVATSALRLTTATPAAVDINNFVGIVGGDIISIVLDSSTCTPAPTVPGTYTFEVSRNVGSTAAALGYLEFKELVSSVSPVTAFGSTPVVFDSGHTFRVLSQSSQDLSMRVAVPTATVDTITIKAHGIPIYNGFVSKFYNAYLPYHYGGPNVSVPKDTGALMIPFNLYTGYMGLWYISLLFLDTFGKIIEICYNGLARKSNAKNVASLFACQMQAMRMNAQKRRNFQNAGKPLGICYITDLVNFNYSLLNFS